jgi:hypothetical protein
MSAAKFFCRYYPGARCNHLYCSRPLNARVKASVPVTAPTPTPKPKGGA